MTSTTEQEANPAPPLGDDGWALPEGALWVPVAPPATASPAPAGDDDTNSPTRSEAPASPPSRRKHVGAVAAAGGVVGGVAVLQAFGVMGLIAVGGAAAGLVAAPVAAYVMYRRRGRNRTPMGRSPRGRRTTRRTTSRLGSTGLSRGRGAKLGKGGRGVSTASRSGGLTGRAARGGLKLGRRGGKATHGAVGRWSKSSGAGAGILGRKAAQRAANTRAGSRVAKAVQAAKQAHGQSAARTSLGRWRAAARAAHSQMPGSRSYSAWAAGIGAGLLALLALLDLQVKAWRAKRSVTADAPTTDNTNTSTDPPWDGSTDGVTHDSDWYTGDSTTGGNRPPPPPAPSPPPPTIKVEVIRDEPVPPAALTAAPLALGPARTTETQPVRKENHMSAGFPLLDAALEFAAVASKYTPESAHGLAPDFDKLPEVIANLAAGFRNYARRIDETEPVHQAVSNELFNLFNGINQLVAPAELVSALHRNIHEADIARGENPRKNEARWNALV